MNDPIQIPAGVHEDVLAWVSRELDSELPERERILLADHLDGCPRCASVAAQLRSAHRALAVDARARPPIGLPDRILARIARAGEAEDAASATADAGEPASRRGGAVVRMLRASAAVAAALLVVVGSVHVAQGPTQAVAGDAPTLEAADPALVRVLERWHKGRAAAPPFFELLLAPFAPAGSRSR